MNRTDLIWIYLFKHFFRKWTSKFIHANGKITEVLNDTEVLVDTAYNTSNIVSNFTSGSFTISYSDFNNQTIGETTLTGSFAKIDITI